MVYRRQWSTPVPLDHERLVGSLSLLSEQHGRLAKEWDKISRAWSLLTAAFLVLSVLFALSLVLQLGVL